MEDSKEVKPERKSSKRDVRSSPKAATLPAGAVLMTNPGEGFFTKIRKCLRLKSKGKYDFAQSESGSSAGNSVARSQSTDSPSNVENGQVEKPRIRSSPLKLSRRSKQDKEEVVLVRKDKRASLGFRLGIKSAGDFGKDDVLVVHVTDDNAEKESGAVVSVSPKQESKLEVDNVFEDFDPDYETLDNVRQKMNCQAEAAHSLNEAAVKCAKTMTSQPLQVRTKTGSEGRDSGLESPFTDTPSSGQGSQAQSITSSMFSSCAVFSESSDPLRESVHSAASMVLMNGEPTGGLTSSMLSDSSQMTCSTSVLQEDDLYSNSKVLFRKKSQKQSQSQDTLTSLKDTEQHSSIRHSLAPTDTPLVVKEEESADSLVPPPLPARNYSEEDIALLSHSTASNDKQSDVRKSSGQLENCLIGAGARPKTTKAVPLLENDSDSPFSDVPAPNLSVDANPYADIDDVEPKSSSADDIHNLDRINFTSSNNIYEDIPARIDTKEEGVGGLQNNNHPFEDELMFIDEDPTVVNPDPENKSNTVQPLTDLSEDVMIVSASDSMCGNEVNESQLSPQKVYVAEHQHTPQALVVQDVGQSALAEFKSVPENSVIISNAVDFAEIRESTSPIDCLQTDKSVEQMPAEDEKKSFELTGASPSSESEPLGACAAAPAAEPHCENATASSSSSSQPLSASTPASSSSSDTLNDMENFDPDDLEGRDQNPPTGLPIHMSHRQVWRRADMRWLTVPPPIPPHRSTSGRSSSRNAKSMDLTNTQLGEDDQAAAASSARRHSSSATTAKLHQDFLESMKQLKDCGWYWGPLSYEEAESKLWDKRDGSFLVRDSSNENYILSLSFKSLGQVHHTRIEHHKGLFSFWSQPDSHGKAQICQFIEQTVENSRNGRFLYFLRPAGPGSPPMPIQLLYPISRFCRVPSLQHMCRFLVLRRVRRDHIDHLPLPQKVKAYLQEKQYYVETLDED